MKAGRSILAAVVIYAAFVLAQDRNPSRQFQQAIDLMATRGDYAAAIRQFEQIAKGKDRSLAARSLLYIGLCYEKLGKEDARRIYQRLVREFPDQREALAEARARLSALAQPLIASSALLVRRIYEGNVDYQGGPSPDGRYLSCTDYEGSGNLALLDLATGAKRPLTQKKSWFESDDFAGSSTISADGRQIAYAWFNEKSGSYELRIQALENGNASVLYHHEETDYIRPAGWSADGKQILAALRGKDGTFRIVLVSVADGSLRFMKKLDQRSPKKMSLSPDGRYVAYDFPTKEDQAGHDIFLIATDGSGETALVEHPANDLSPVWTPNGKGVVFVSDRTGTYSLWVVPVGGGRAQGPPVLIKRDMGQIVPMGFTTRGSYYYGVVNAMNDVYIATLDPVTGKVKEQPKAANPRLVGASDYPDWSPDGKQLAYVTRLGSAGAGRNPLALTILSLETGEQRQLDPQLQFYVRLRWSPDGSSILTLGRDHANRGGLFQIDAQTGQVTTILYSPSSQGFPREADWSPDGKAIFYSHVSGPIMLRDFATGREREIHSGVIFALSRDGSLLAVHSEDRATKSSIVKVVLVAGGEARELLREPGPGAFTFAWAADGRSLLFTKSRELWRIPVQGADPQPMGLAMANLRAIRVHPDGRRIAFSAAGGNSEIWVMENMLPVLQALGMGSDTPRLQVRKGAPKRVIVR